VTKHRRDNRATSYFRVENVLCSRRSVGVLYKWVLTHSIVVSCLHPRRAETGTSAFRSAISSKWVASMKCGEKTHQEERLHFVLVPHWHFVDVNDGSIPTTWNATVRLDRTEYLPSMLTIALISCETERDEQRLDCFRPVIVQLAPRGRRGIKTCRSIYRASYGGNSPTLRAMP
jgi:hypothetical protein